MLGTILHPGHHGARSHTPYRSQLPGGWVWFSPNAFLSYSFKIQADQDSLSSDLAGAYCTIELGTIFFCKLFKKFIITWKSARKRSSICWLTPPKGHHDQSFASPQLRTWSFLWVSHRTWWPKHLSLPSLLSHFISRELGQSGAAKNWTSIHMGCWQPKAGGYPARPPCGPYLLNFQKLFTCK